MGSKRILDRIRLMLMAVVFIFAYGIGTNVAQAQTAANRPFFCGFTVYGRAGCQGLLSNNDYYDYDPGDTDNSTKTDVIIANLSDINALGVPASVKSLPTFLSYYEGLLARGSPSKYDYDSFGAAFTIDVMLGVTGPGICEWYTGSAQTTCTWPAAVAYAQDPSHLNDWVSRVTYYDNNGWIDFNQSMFIPKGYPDSGHVCKDWTGCWGPSYPPVTPRNDAQDIVWHGNPVATTDPVIQFNKPGTSPFTIDRICGNWLGLSTGLVPPVPPATVSCAGLTTGVLTADPNRPFTLKVAVQYNPGSAASAAFGPDRIALQLSGPAPYAGYSQSTSSPAISGGIATASFTIPATDVSGTFSATWQVTGPQAPTVSCSAPVTVAYQPYFDVVGGDVSVGQGFGGGCTDNTAADIKGYNLDSGGASPNYFGAGSRQMALATGDIAGFASDETNDTTNNLGGSTDGIAAHLPSGLAGSNVAPGASNYGSHFLGSYAGNWCVPDYVSKVTGTADYTTPPDWNSLMPNSAGYIVRLTGDQTLGGIQLRPGVRVTVVVTGGSVYLDGNITYASYTALQDVPQFNLLISGGDIFIDPGVSELHGFYDAQPAGNTNGQIFTCANGNGLTHVLKDYAACGVRPLTIYGAVAANQAILGRTTGNIARSGGVSDVPAERVIYTPELWFGGLAAPPTSCDQDPTQSRCMYQSYTPLPPVL